MSEDKKPEKPIQKPIPEKPSQPVSPPIPEEIVPGRKTRIPMRVEPPKPWPRPGGESQPTKESEK